MTAHYHHNCIEVNHHHCFTANNYGCTLSRMTLAERLLKAREHAKLRQDELAKKSGVSQQAISRLETGLQKGSTDIVKLAVACGVRPEWLALEDGLMVESIKYNTDPLIGKVVNAMQHMDVEDERYLVIMSEAIVNKRELETRQLEPAKSQQEPAPIVQPARVEAPEQPTLPKPTPKRRRFKGVSNPAVGMVKPLSTSTVNSKLKGEKK